MSNSSSIYLSAFCILFFAISIAISVANCKLVLKKNSFNCECNLLHCNAIEQYLLLILMLVESRRPTYGLGMECIDSHFTTTNDTENKIIGNHCPIINIFACVHFTGREEYYMHTFVCSLLFHT